MSRDVVECIMVNEKMEVLLQKKTLDYLLHPGMWGIFGGVIEEREDPKKAIIREIYEETGMTIKPRFYTSRDYEHGNAKIFIAEIDDASQISLKEGAGFAFIDKKELNDIKINSFDLQTLMVFFKEK